MPVRPIAARVACLDGSEFVIENADRLADAFFALDRSSRGEDSYDAMTSRTSPNRVERADVDAINGPMRARSKHEAWEDLFAEEHLPWLAAIESDSDLMADDDTWEAKRAPEAIRGALVGIMAPYRNVSVATKMLHLKRPALFPVLDRLVVEGIKGYVSSTASVPTRASQSLAVINHLREQARANASELLEIQTSLAMLGTVRTTTRILGGLLWMTHPDSELSPLRGRYRSLAHRRRRISMSLVGEMRSRRMAPNSDRV